jgi:tetratricopeptide (TPR) repeat protein
MRRHTLNVRFLLALLTLLGAIVGGVWAAHRRQAGKQAGLYLARADALERDGDKAAAATYLRRYLVHSPADTAARGRFGLLLADTATDADGLFQALLVLDQAVREDPARDDLRRRAAALGTTLGTDTLPGATEHYTALIAAHPPEAELYFSRGKCHELAESFPAAEADYRAAVKLNAAHVPAAARLAGVLRGRLGRPREADVLVAKMTDRDPRAADAQLAAATYWKEVTRSGSAAERPTAEKKHAAAVAAALALTPTDLATVQAAADLAIARSREAERKHDPAAARAAAAEAAKLLEGGIAVAKLPAAAATLEGRAEVERQRERIAKLYHTRAAVALDAGRFDEAETWLTRGLDAYPNSAGLVGQLAETFTRAGRLPDAEAQIDRLRELKHPEGLIGYRRARVLAAQGDWPAAARTCEAALPDLAANPDLAREARYFLGECFEQLGQPDRRQAALREALPVDPADPLWMPARAKLAASLLDLGRTADAAEVYENLAARYADAKVPLARLLLAEQRRRPPVAREFSRVTAALEAAPPTAERDLLKVDLKHAVAESVDPAKVRADVLAVRDAYPDAAEPYLALAALELRAGDPAAAARWLDSAEKNPKVGDRVDLRLVRANLPAADFLALATGAEKFKPADRVRLLVGLSDLVPENKPAVAVELLDRAAAAAPTDLGVLLARFERAVRADRAKAVALLAEVRKLDEFGGTSAKMSEAILLLKDAEAKPAGDDRAADLRRAGELLGEAEPARPHWNRIPLALAAVRDLQGDTAGATAAYRRAVELGVRDAAVVRRLTELLTAQKRFAEVNQLLRDLPGTGGRAAAEAALASRDLSRAAKLAADTVPEDSKDAAALVWLGQVRFLAGDRDGAAKPFRRAIDVAPEQPAPWVALVGYLVATGRPAEAEETTATAAKRITPTDRPAALAACYESLGRPDRAADLYRDLAKEKPTDAAVLRDAGRFALRAGRAAEAADLFKRAVALPKQSAADVAAARRLYAISLAAQPNQKTAAEALKVLDATDESVEALKARAVVLGAQPNRKQKAEAAALLERVEGRSPLGAEEQFLLAQLYATIDDRPKARRRFAALVAANGENPTYLAVYARWLLKANDADAARPLVEKLQTLDADSRPTVELTARLAVADDRRDAAADVLLKYADRPGDRATAILPVMEDLGLGDKAEPLVARIAAAAPHPTGLILRAEFLARRGKVADAVASLREKRDTIPPAALARAAVNVLHGGRRAGADDPAADELVAEAARRAPGEPKVLLQQALLADFRGKYDEAAKLFRRVIDTKPELAVVAVAANNLAFLAAARGQKHDDALALLRQAEDAVGPSPDVSDTEGYVQLARKEPAAAVEALADAVATGGGSVVRYHLAAAHLAAGDKLKAATEWALAHRDGFTAADLHPLERPEYDLLKSALRR